MSQIDSLLKNLLSSYIRPLLPRDPSTDISPEDHDRYEQESEQAWCALETLFKHLPSFSKAILSDVSDEGQTKASETLISWARQLQWPVGGSSGLWKPTTQTADECCKKTSVFMQDKMWLFTKIIR